MLDTRFAQASKEGSDLLTNAVPIINLTAELLCSPHNATAEKLELAVSELEAVTSDIQKVIALMGTLSRVSCRCRETITTLPCLRRNNVSERQLF